MVRYYVGYEVESGRIITKWFNTKKDALKFAYQKAKNFRSEVKLGRSTEPLYHDGQVVCIKNKRFYIAFNHKKNAKSPYGREYILYSDGTLGE